MTKNDPTLFVANPPLVHVTKEELDAQAQWMRDGTIPASYLRLVLGDILTPVYAFAPIPGGEELHADAKDKKNEGSKVNQE